MSTAGAGRSLGAVKRGCGFRVPGSLYIEVLTGPDGKPLEFFLADPPRPVDAKALGITPRGMHPVTDADGVTHVFDWVGSQHYPAATDILEETRAFGLSRRIPRTFPFESLGPGSRIVLLHARGYLANHAHYYQALETGWRCPKARDDHRDLPWPEAMCAGLWWDDLDPALAGERIEGRQVWRQIGATRYPVRIRPEGLTPRYQVAIIAAFPIGRIAAIRDRHGGAHEAAMRAASRARLPITLEDV